MAIWRPSTVVALLLTISGNTVSNVMAQNNGDTICVDGYIMDRFCIDRGTLLDDSDTETLENPERHSIHCLVDVGVCRNSPFHILEDLGNRYGEGWSVTDNDPLIDLARAVGRCSTCDGDGNQRSGFQAAVRGVVVDADDRVLQIEEVAETGTDLCSNRPEPQPTDPPVPPPPHDGSTGTIEDVGDNGEPQDAFPLRLCQGDCDDDDECGPGLVCRQRENEDDPVSIFCEGTPEDDNDYCVPENEEVEVEDGDEDEEEEEEGEEEEEEEEESEDLEPTIVTSNDTLVDCSDFQHELQVPGLEDVTLQYVVNYANNTGTMSVRIEYKGQGWIGFGVSPTGGMLGSDAVLGVPSTDQDGSVNKYHLTFDGGANGYVLLGEDQQTLMDASIVQDEDSTVMEFTKLLVEGEGEIPINGTGFNYFLIAHGTDTNELGYHGPTGRAPFSLTLSPCIETLDMEELNVTVGTIEDVGDDETMEDTNEEEEAGITVVRTFGNKIERPKEIGSVNRESDYDATLENQGNPDNEMTAGEILRATSGVDSSTMKGGYMFLLFSTLAAYFCY